MLIGVPAETMAGETRVAATPETVKKLRAQGHVLRVQSGAGVAASVPDALFEAAGAEIVDAAGALGADLVLKVRIPSEDELPLVRKGATLVGMLTPSSPQACSAWPMRASRPMRWRRLRAPRVRRAWTCCPARPISPATRP